MQWQMRLSCRHLSDKNKPGAAYDEVQSTQDTESFLVSGPNLEKGRYYYETFGSCALDVVHKVIRAGYHWLASGCGDNRWVQADRLHCEIAYQNLDHDAHCVERRQSHGSHLALAISDRC